MVKNGEFKQNINGTWELFIEDKSFGISFEIPKDHNIEEYDFQFIDSGKILPCKDVVFVLDKPSTIKSITIDSEADTTFSPGLKIKVRESLFLGKNSNLSFTCNDLNTKTSMPSFEHLSIKSNTNTTINFEKPTRAVNKNSLNQLDKDGIFPYKNNKIEGNKNLNISMSSKIKCLYLHYCEDLGADGVKFCIKNSSYLYMDNSVIAKTPTAPEYNSLTIDSDVLALPCCDINVSGDNFLEIKPTTENNPSIFGNLDIEKASLFCLDTNSKIIADFINFEPYQNSNSNSNSPVLGLEGNTLIEVGGDLTIAGDGHLENTTIKSPNTPLRLDNQFIVTNGYISFADDQTFGKGQKRENCIGSFTATNIDIKEVDGFIHGSMTNVQGKKLTINRNFDLTLGGEKSNCVFDNISLEKCKCVMIRENFFMDKPIKININNLLIKESDQNINIFCYKDATLSNVVLENLNVDIGKDDKNKKIPFVAENSILKGDIELKNVASIRSSELDSVGIVSDTSVDVKDAWIKNEYIKDYASYLDKKHEADFTKAPKSVEVESEFKPL